MSPPLNTTSGALASLKDVANPKDEFVMFSLVLFTFLSFLGAKKLTFDEFVMFKSITVLLFISNTALSISSIASPGVVSKVMFSYILLESITDAGSL